MAELLMDLDAEVCRSLLFTVLAKVQPAQIPLVVLELFLSPP